MGTFTTKATTLPSILNTSSNNEGPLTSTLNTSIKNNLLLVIPNVEAINRLHSATKLDATDRNNRRLHNATTPSPVDSELVTTPAQQLEYRGFALGANKGFVSTPIAALTTATLGTNTNPPCSYIPWDPACATGACATKDCRMSSPLAIKV